MTVWHNGGGGPALVRVDVDVDVKVFDTFTRTAANGWGDTDTGQAWTVAGTASDYSVAGGAGIHSVGSLESFRDSSLGVVAADVDVTVANCGIGSAPTVGNAEVGVAVRYLDGQNYCDLRIIRLGGGTVLCIVRQVVAGVEAVSASPTIAGATSATDIAIRIQATGTTLQGKAWPAGTLEPAAWTVTLTVSHLAAGDIHLRSLLSAACTNPLPVPVDFDDIAVVYATTIDISGDVLHDAGGLSIDMAGRQSELARVDNAVLELVVSNRSGWYTPGYSHARYELRQGQPIRVYETVGRRSWPLFTGTLQQPEAIYGATPNEAVVAVAAVDRFGELDQGRQFISTLGEYIRDAGGTALAGYWPLGDAAGATQAEPAVAGQGPLTTQRRTDYGSAGAAPPGSLLTFGSTAGPPMDDLNAVSFQPLRSDILPLARDWLVNRALTGLAFTGVEAVAVSMWYLPSSDYTGDWQALVIRDATFTNSITIQTLNGGWIGYFATNAGTATVPAAGVRLQTWQLLTVHLVIATGVVSFWIDRGAFTGTVGAGSTGDFTSLLVDAGSPNSAAGHLQLYAGPTSVVNRQLHLAQYAQGTDPYTGGLRFQRSDERFTTLCRYAGVTGTQTDYGTTWLQPAELAGQSFAEAVDVAARTEQGRCFVDGAGVATFHSRIRARYNV